MDDERMEWLVLMMRRGGLLCACIKEIIFVVVKEDWLRFSKNVW